MVEDYEINTRMSRGYTWYEGEDHRKSKKHTVLITVYQTVSGNMDPEDWKRRLKSEIEKYGFDDRLKWIECHCKENCAWLYDDIQIEEYALECITSHAYLFWPEFMEQHEIMAFIFDFDTGEMMAKRHRLLKTEEAFTNDV